MTAAATVQALHAAGLTLSLTPDRGVKAAPASRLTSELRHLIRTNLEDLRSWLQAANDPASGDPDRWCWPNDPSPDAAMNTGEVEAFTARVLAFMGRGLGLRQAEKLADRLKRRDREGDDRHACIECRRLTAARACTAWRQAGIGGPQVGALLTKLQRCPGFAPVLTPTEKTP